MRPILFVIHQVGPKANGGLQSITELMTGLKQHRPVILTNLDSEITGIWRTRGWDVHVEPMPETVSVRTAPLAWLRTYFRYARVVRGLLRSTGARVIHANDPLAVQLSLLAARRVRGTRIAFSLRGTFDPDRRPPRYKYRLLFGLVDHMFYLSADMAERWRRVAGNATRACSVTYSIADSARFRPSPFSEGGPPVVLLSGIFNLGKGQLEFIRNVVPTLASAGIETWFAGDFDPQANDYAAACKAAAMSFKDQIRFLGYRNDLPELIRQASVVAIPSRHEGLMRGMIEAMSSGRPVVSFDVCSAREILEDKASGAGVVVGLGDHQGMAEAVLRYATDRDARAAAGQAGTAGARALFDADQVVERYERVYRQLDGDR